MLFSIYLSITTGLISWNTPLEAAKLVNLEVPYSEASTNIAAAIDKLVLWLLPCSGAVVATCIFSHIP